MVGSHSATVELYQAIIAGCALATRALKVLLCRTMVRCQLRHPTTTLRVFVDDVSIQWKGQRISGAFDLMRATREVKQGLVELGLVVSDGKSKLVASTERMAKLLRQPCKRLALKQSKWARNLGHDCAAPGAGRRIMRQRLQGAKSRLPKLRRFLRVARTKGLTILPKGVSTSAVYTAAVTGGQHTGSCSSRGGSLPAQWG